MSQVNRTTGMVRIRNLSCIREEKPLTGRDDPVDKKVVRGKPGRRNRESSIKYTPTLAKSNDIC